MSVRNRVFSGERSAASKAFVTATTTASREEDVAKTDCNSLARRERAIRFGRCKCRKRFATSARVTVIDVQTLAPYGVLVAHIQTIRHTFRCISTLAPDNHIADLTPKKKLYRVRSLRNTGYSAHARPRHTYDACRPKEDRWNTLRAYESHIVFAGDFCSSNFRICV